jgi:nucleoside-diphosphate-sugar epimerase
MRVFLTGASGYSGGSVAQRLVAEGHRVILSLASNGRVRGRKSREMLGWVPRGPSLLEEIEHGYYACRYGRA